MIYFMFPIAKEILFSTGILFIHFLNSKWRFSKCSTFRFCQIQGLSKASSTFNPNIITTCSTAIFEWK